MQNITDELTQYQLQDECLVKDGKLIKKEIFVLAIDADPGKVIKKICKDLKQEHK